MLLLLILLLLILLLLADWWCNCNCDYFSFYFYFDLLSFDLDFDLSSYIIDLYFSFYFYLYFYSLSLLYDFNPIFSFLCIAIGTKLLLNSFNPPPQNYCGYNASFLNCTLILFWLSSIYLPHFILLLSFLWLPERICEL